MWDLIVSVPDHCLSFYLVRQVVFIFSLSSKILHVLSTTNVTGLYFVTMKYYLILQQMFKYIFCSNNA